MQAEEGALLALIVMLLPMGHELITGRCGAFPRFAFEKIEVAR